MQLTDTDINGNSTISYYDTFNRLVKVVKPGDNYSSPSIQYLYQHWGTLAIAPAPNNSQNSKWSLFGAMGEAAQVVSNEIPLALSAVIPVMIVGTMDLVEIGDRPGGLVDQLGGLPRPLHLRHVLHLYDVRRGQRQTTPRSTWPRRRANWSPASSPNTPASAGALFFMAEYASMFAIMPWAVILFLGGWNGPVPIAHWLGMVADPRPAGYIPHPLWGGTSAISLGMCNILV